MRVAKPKMRVTEADIERMAVAAATGVELIPTTPRARQLWEQIKRETAAAKARGLMIEIPSDWP